MISLHIRISDFPPHGCAIEMIPRPEEPSLMETAHFRILEMALNAACQIILETAKSGGMIEEQGVSDRVRAAFQRMTQKPADS